MQAVGRHWLIHSESQKVLECLAASDPNADLSRKALRALRRIRLYELNAILESRLTLARNKTSAPTPAATAAADKD
jgi:hypothetical protein